MPRSGIESLDEADLIEAAKTSRDAFACLYETYLPVVYGYLRRRTESHEVAEDLASATFEKAFLALPAYEWRGVPFGAWLVRIASRKLTDHFRLEARRATDPVDPVETLADACDVDRTRAREASIETRVGEAEQVGLILEALDDIPARYRKAIALRFLSELTTEEAAEALGCTRSTFAVLLHRSVHSLRKAVERRGKVI